MKSASVFREALSREIILEALEDRIVLDAAVDHTLVDHSLADIAAHATEAVGHGDAAAHTADAAGVNPAGYWAWEHNAWCYHDTSSMWWWWPDASSPQGGNWLYQGDGWTGMWSYDWNHGWEWFFNAFYNNRYYQDSGLYWGQDGNHNWYFTSDPHGNWNFSTWTAAEGHSVVVNVDFEPLGSGGLCQDASGSWHSYGSISADVALLVADIRPGGNSSGPSGMTALDGDLYFSAYDPTHGAQLWQYDPLTHSVEIVGDIHPGTVNDPSAQSHHEWTVLDGVLYFGAVDEAHGEELWRYDPVTNSAQMVADINPGPVSGIYTDYILFHEFTVLDGVLYFQADDGTHGVELWRYDPGTSVTQMVADINPGSDDSSPNYLTVLDHQLYFQAYDGTNGTALWRYDPGTGAAQMVINPGTYVVGPHDLTALDGVLYFGAYTATQGDELCRYDPGTGTAQMVADINPGSNSSFPTGLTGLNGDLYFQANDGTHGYELWRYDPGTGATQMVADINPGANSSQPLELTVLNGALYFQADDGTHGPELWRYDPGTETAHMVASIFPGSDEVFYTNYLYLTPFDGNVYFEAENVWYGGELWRTGSVADIGGVVS
jgi:ELWxxDGT repeat protein